MAERKSKEEKQILSLFKRGLPKKDWPIITGDPFSLPGQVEVPVSNLGSGVDLDAHKKNQITKARERNIVSRTLDDPEVAKNARLAFMGLSGLIDEIRQDRKKATYVLSAGGITLFVATLAGIEFGVRGGKDVKELINKLFPPEVPQEEGEK